MPRVKRVTEPTNRNSPPATTLEARENQLILLATNLAEKQLRDGTASSQVIAHYLKLGTTRERLEQERLRNENDLVRAKTESYKDAKEQASLYAEALEAFRSYSGHGDECYED